MTVLRLASDAPVASTLTVRLAAYGTLSNGSDVQLLAQPADLSLSTEAKRNLRAFFNAAWQAAARREAPYFAFMPLEDGEHWVLSRVDRMGRGAAGWVVVVWSALIAIEELGRIEWSSHRLLRNAFPAPNLPAVDTLYGPHPATLGAASALELDAYQRAFDWLLLDIGLFQGQRAAIRVEPPREPGLEPLTPEGALFGLWSRLGRSREELSYCTWAGLETADYPPRDLPFHAVFTEANAVVQERPNRRQLTLGVSADGGRGQDLPRQFRILRAMEGAPSGDGDWAPASEHEAELAARALGEDFFRRYRESIAAGDRSIFAAIAKAAAGLPDGPILRAGLYELLRSTLVETPKDQVSEILQTFIDGAWPYLGGPGAARNQTATAALQGGAWPCLSPAVLLALGPALFADAGRDGAFGQAGMALILDAPAKALQPDAIIGEIQRHEGWRSPGAVPLLQLLIASAWPSRQAEALLERLASVHGYDAVTPLAHHERLPLAEQGSMMAKILSLRPRPPVQGGVVEQVRHRRRTFWLRDTGWQVLRRLTGARTDRRGDDG